MSLARLAEEALRSLSEPPRRPARRLWVSELAGCLLQAYLERVSPRPWPPEAVLVAQMGRAVHELIEARLAALGARVEQRVSAEVHGWMIVGKVDVLGDDAVLEVKTVDSVEGRSEPRLDHARQARFYAGLLGKRIAYILYVARSDGRWRLYELRVEPGEAVRELAERARRLVESLESGRPPDPEPGEWCRWCPYRGQCPA